MIITQVEDKLSIVSEETTWYKYVHTVQSVTIAGTVLVNSEVTDSISYYTFLSDGYFIITEMKLPTNPGNYYYITGDDIISPNGDEISVSELLAVNIEGTTIIKTTEDYITKYMLDSYYIDLIKSKFMKDICSCGCSCTDSQDKVRLDALTMGLDLIDILEVQLQYNEVQRIVEKLQVCFGMVENDCNCD